MFDVIKSISGSASIIALKVIADKIIFLTNKYLLLIYDKVTFAVQYKKQLVAECTPRHVYDKTFSISSELDFCLTPIKSPSSYKYFLLKYIDSLKKSKSTNQPTSKAIYCSAFSHRSDMLAIGTEDGRTFIYASKENTLLKSFPPRADYISHLCFSSDDKFLAISSFDKNNIIYSFAHGKEIIGFETKDVIEESIFVDNNSKLVAVNRERKFLVFDMQEKLCKELKIEFAEWPTSLVSINQNYVVVGTKGKCLYIVDYVKDQILHTITFDNKGITSLQVDDNRLYVGFIDGEVKIIDMQSNLELFTLNLKINKFEEASELIEKNIFLITHESAKKFDEAWPDILAKAQKLILSGNIDEARKIAVPFFFDAVKNDEFLCCLGNIKQYALFVEHIENKKYIEAFKLADKYEYLKNSQDFEVIQKYFIRLVHDVKLLFGKGDDLSINQAKKIIREYAVIPSKENLVNNLLIKYKVFVHAEKFIKNRDFKSYFILVKQNEFLQEEEVYNRVIQIGNLTFAKLNNHEQENDYEQALSIAKYLRDFLPFKEDVDKKVNIINKTISLIENISVDNIREVYRLVDKENSLELSSHFLSYHENFLDLKKKAHEAAINGDGASVMTILKQYLDIKYTIHLIAQEFKLTYLTQMEAQMTDNSDQSLKWPETLKLYVSYFGVDYEVSDLCEKYGFSDKLKSIENPNCFNGYENLKFVPSVLVQG